MKPLSVPSFAELNAASVLYGFERHPQPFDCTGSRIVLTNRIIPLTVSETVAVRFAAALRGIRIVGQGVLECIRTAFEAGRRVIEWIRRIRAGG